MAIAPIPRPRPLETPAGSIALKRVELRSEISKFQLNLQPLIQEMSIYEDIQSPFIMADMVLADALALTTIAPLVGQEIIFIQVEVEGIEEVIDLNFRIISIEQYKPSNIRTALYSIHLASHEYIRDVNTKIMQSYRMPVSEAVQSICEQYLKISSKPLNISPTSGERVIVIPNMHPTKAIAFLAREGQSPNFVASNFVFFESRKGFNFITLDELIGQPPPEDADRDFDKYYASEKDTVGQQDGDSGKPPELMKITSFTFLNLFSNDKTLAMGGFENKVLCIDPVKSLVETKQYDYFTDYGRFQRTSRNETGGKFITESNTILNEGDANFNLIYYNSPTSNVDTDQKPDYFHLMKASKGMLDNIVVNVIVPGNPARHVGDIIHLEFPEYGGTDDVMKDINRFISGKYFVSSLRHLYTKDRGYEMIMQCIKNCYEHENLALIEREAFPNRVQQQPPQFPTTQGPASPNVGRGIEQQAPAIPQRRSPLIQEPLIRRVRPPDIRNS